MNNEQDILRRAQQGDSEAFRLLVAAYQTQVYRLALRMCGEAAADDVTQEAFLAAWRALPEFRGTCRFSTWLYRLTTNAAIDWLRREKRHRGMDDVTELELPDDGPGPQDQAEQAEAQQAVRRALSRLSEEHRQVLLLRYMQELDYAEIAAALVALDIVCGDCHDDLAFRLHHHEHADLAVRPEARQNARGVEIVKEFAAELQIELAAELIEALGDALRLEPDILVVVKADLSHIFLPLFYSP